MNSRQTTGVRTLLLVASGGDARGRLRRLLMFEIDARILEAASAPSALDILDRHRVDVVLTGHHLPMLDGVELLRRARVRAPETVRLLIASGRDLALATAALANGDVSRGLRTPVLEDQLVAAVRLAFEDAELQAELHRLRAIRDTGTP